MWGGYGSSPGAPASPLYTATSTGTYARALASAYDAKNRLSKVSIAAANTPQSNTQSSADTVSYRINALGQRVQKIGAGLFAAAATNPTSPFAITLSNPPTALQLQALNTQTQAFYANSRFVYDEQGRLLGEYAKDGKLIAETVWFGDLPIALLKPKGANVLQPTSGTTTTGNQGANNIGANGNTGVQPAAANPTDSVATERFYVHPDHLGTPRVITKPQAGPTYGDNVQVWRWDSDPFGSNATANSAPNENPLGTTQVVGTATLPYLFKMNHRFPGQLSDEETGKHYNYFRDYDPSVGRYTTSDPIGLRGGLSTFTYAKNAPTLHVDPLGLQSFHPPNPALNTVVCDGNGGIIPQFSNNNGDLSCGIGECITAHENKHISDLQMNGFGSACSGRPRGTIVSFNTNCQLYQSEVAASEVELACLRGKCKDKCGDCKTRLETRIAQIEESLQAHKGRASAFCAAK